MNDVIFIPQFVTDMGFTQVSCDKNTTYDYNIQALQGGYFITFLTI